MEFHGCGEVETEMPSWDQVKGGGASSYRIKNLDWWHSLKNTLAAFGSLILSSMNYWYWHKA